jgi:hypothetical protein
MRPFLRAASVLITALIVITVSVRGDAKYLFIQDSSPSKAAASPAPPPLLLLDRQFIAEVAARARSGDPSLKAAVVDLEREAAKALTMTPVSVMDKGIVPPSGDKHDYMSQAPYWWPDPSKPDGRPYIRKDGQRNPEINKLTDHENFDRVFDAVSTLGLAYFMTGRNEYAAKASTLVRTWFLDPATRMNPHLKFGQGIPGINDGRGIGIIETRGLPQLLDGIQLLAGSSSWTAADQSGLEAWMRAYVSWLTDSPHGKDESTNGNNHETWYDVQVAALALFTQQRDLARQTIERSRERITRQIEPDGRQPRELERTLAWHYSIFNLTAFFQLAALGERVGVDVWGYATNDGRSLRRALDFLVPFADGRAKWPYPEMRGIDAGAIHWLLRRAAAAWRAPEYRALASKVGGGQARLDLIVP